MHRNDSGVKDKVHIVWGKNSGNTVSCFWSVSTRLCPSAAPFEVCIVLFPTTDWPIMSDCFPAGRHSPGLAHQRPNYAFVINVTMGSPRRVLRWRKKQLWSLQSHKQLRATIEDSLKVTFAFCRDVNGGRDALGRFNEKLSEGGRVGLKPSLLHPVWPAGLDIEPQWLSNSPFIFPQLELKNWLASVNFWTSSCV